MKRRETHLPTLAEATLAAVALFLIAGSSLWLPWLAAIGEAVR